MTPSHQVMLFSCCLVGFGFAFSMPKAPALPAAPPERPRPPALLERTAPPPRPARVEEPAPSLELPSRTGAALDDLKSVVAKQELGRLLAATRTLRASLEGASLSDVAAVLRAFETATDAVLENALLDALAPHGLRRPEARERLGRLALDGGAPVARRAAAVHALGRARHDVTPVDLLTRLATKDTSVDVRVAATSALAQVLRAAPVAHAPVRKTLVALLRDGSTLVRCTAAEGFHAAGAEDTLVQQLLAHLEPETDATARQAIARALGAAGAASRRPVQQALVDAFAREKVHEVRATELASIVRLNPLAALPVLDLVVERIPELALDARAYREAIRAGALSWERIWRAKQASELARGEDHDD